ncbi:MAG: hypothetical protein N3B13_10895, partial [Deltaproteobacteria bacterium]|nr:hypothetical protein [Deltaproteobacteria bacterium]
GKTALITTDELWRFSFSEKTPDEFNLYNKFMNNLLLWITGEPDKEDIVLSYGRNQKSSEELKGKYSGIIHGSEINMQTDDGTVINGKINADGEFSFDISNIPEGIHRGRISYQNQSYSIFFYKRRTDTEMQDTAPRPEVLKSIARYSGGKYFTGKEGIKNLKTAKKTVKKIQNTSKLPIWNKSILLAVLLSLFFAEWFLRRMYGHQ